MHLSIFPNCEKLPKSKAAKTKSAMSAIVPSLVEIVTEVDLISTIENYVWSPFTFTGNRKQENFKSCDFAVLDIDEGLSIDEAEAIVNRLELTCLAMVTTSHTKENPRFRLIFPIIRTITRVDEYVATMTKLAESFPTADPSCITDHSRIYFGGTQEDGFWIESNFLKVETPTIVAKQRYSSDNGVQVKVDMSLQEIVKELYGSERSTIPESVHYFLTEAKTGIPNGWWSALNACVFSIAMVGIDEDTILDLIEYVSPEPLDKRDLDCISRAFKDGSKVYEEQLDK